MATAPSGESVTANKSARFDDTPVCGASYALLFSAAPDVKRVSKNDVPHQVVIRTIVNVQRGVELEIRCDIAGEANGR